MISRRVFSPAPHRWTAALLVGLLAVSTLLLSRARTGESSNDSEKERIHWVNGELAPPLPQDPELRAQAIAQARANLERTRIEGRIVPAGTEVRTVSWKPLTRLSQEIVLDPESSARPSKWRRRPDRGRSLESRMPNAQDLMGRRMWPAGKERSQQGTDGVAARPPGRVREDGSSSLISGRMTSGDSEALAAPHALLTPSLYQDFDGLDYTGYPWPDPDIAVGPSYVMEVVNSEFAAYAKCGGEYYWGDFAAYFGDTVSTFYQPKVIYDAWSNRWVMTVLVLDNAASAAAIYIMASYDSDPSGSWHAYSLGYGPTDFPDDPDIAVGTQALYITDNTYLFSGLTFQWAEIQIIDKSEIYNGAPSGVTTFYSLPNPADGSKAISIRPAQMHYWPGEMLFVNTQALDDSLMTLWRLSYPLTSPTLTATDVAGLISYRVPPLGVQPDSSTLYLGDCRLQNAVYGQSRIWTGQSTSFNWGGGNERSILWMYVIDTATDSVVQQGGLGSASYDYAFPAIDVDRWPDERGIAAFTRMGLGEYPSARYAEFLTPGGWSLGAPLMTGEANFSSSSSPPYTWGTHVDVARDPTDLRTMWMAGAFAASSPAGSWDTQIGAVTFETPVPLSVSCQADTFISLGYAPGPYNPVATACTLSNAGSTSLTWALTGLDSWQAASLTEGELAGGDQVVVEIAIDSLVASNLAAGIYEDYYQFEDCMNQVSHVRKSVLGVGTEGGCPGSVVDMVPEVPSTPGFADLQERGTFVSMMKDFELCAIGIMADLVLPQTLTARIYQADGTSRGLLLASSTVFVVEPGMVMHYVPVTTTLYGCQDYDIAVLGGEVIEAPWWDETALTEPFDVKGVVRVRDGELLGNAANISLQHITLLGRTVCENTSDLDPGGTGYSWNSDNDSWGVVVRPQQTLGLCSIGWQADLVPDQPLTASVYEMAGPARGPLIAEGTYWVSSSGMQFHDIPIHAVLTAGTEYDLSVAFGSVNSWSWFSENQVPTPYGAEMFDVVTAEHAGDTGDSVLAHYRVGWGPAWAGSPFDLGPPTALGGDPFLSVQPTLDYGIFVTSHLRQDVYALGWMADVPQGEPIGVNIYEAAGSVRGPLIASGAAVSEDAGMRWHDIPISAGLEPGADYDFEVDIHGVNVWPLYTDAFYGTYAPYGIITVRDGEQGGDSLNLGLPQLRIHACSEASTPVISPTLERPRFYLGLPEPNPIVTNSLLRFSLERAGEVSLCVFDVQGRRVETVCEGRRYPAGPSFVRYDASRLASGVYFLRLESNQKMVSRKMIVVH